MREGLAVARGFMGPLIVEYRDGHEWVIRQEFLFCSVNAKIGCVHIPIGFVTDFASIPRFFWRVLHPTHAHIGKAAVVHDALYRSPGFSVSRLEADAVLTEGMQVLGAPWWKRKAVYAAVRAGGGHAYVPRHLP